jgi:uncharacterized protein YjbI with pentapeptide repeats
MSEKEKIQIKSRWTGEALFACEVDASLPTWELKMGAAVKLAVKTRADLAGAHLAGANLADAYLARASLASADLADANLASADLTNARLAGAHLAGANLADAYLAGANLAGAYLARASLASADLTNARLAGAHLAGANLARAKDIIRIDCDHPWPLILRNGDPVMVSCGCRWMAPEGLREHWQQHADDHRRDVMIPALDAALAIAKAKGWGA